MERPDYIAAGRVPESPGWYWVWDGYPGHDPVVARVYQDELGNWAWGLGQWFGEYASMARRFPWRWSEPIQRPGASRGCSKCGFTAGGGDCPACGDASLDGGDRPRGWLGKQLDQASRSVDSLPAWMRPPAAERPDPPEGVGDGEAWAADYTQNHDPSFQRALAEAYRAGFRSGWRNAPLACPGGAT